MPTVKKPHNCLTCHKDFIGRSKQQYCSLSCSARAEARCKDPIKDFLALCKVAENDCWIWQGATFEPPNAYGSFSWRQNRVLAHRYMWELVHGDIKGGLHVLHKCDVKLCVNPDHLFLGTNADNMHDKWLKGRCRNLSGPDCPWFKLNLEVMERVKHLKEGGYTYREIMKIVDISMYSVWLILYYFNMVKGRKPMAAKIVNKLEALRASAEVLKAAKRSEK